MRHTIAARLANASLAAQHLAFAEVNVKTRSFLHLPPLDPQRSIYPCVQACLEQFSLRRFIADVLRMDVDIALLHGASQFGDAGN